MDQCGSATQMTTWRRESDDTHFAVRFMILRLRVRQLVSLAVMIGVLLALAFVGIAA
jgi:hypothetical protein